LPAPFKNALVEIEFKHLALVLWTQINFEAGMGWVIEMLESGEGFDSLSDRGSLLIHSALGLPVRSPSSRHRSSTPPDHPLTISIEKADVWIRFTARLLRLKGSRSKKNKKDKKGKVLPFALCYSKN
jgi:hypothetical protein